MNNKIQTVYEILGTDNSILVNDILDELSSEERILCSKRWGNDLENPILDSSWNSSDSMTFHTKVVPHMKKILETKLLEDIKGLENEYVDDKTINLESKLSYSENSKNGAQDFFIYKESAFKWDE